MTIFRTGKPQPPSKRKPTAAPASGFALWTWAAQSRTEPTEEQAVAMVESYRTQHPAIADVWATKTPEEVLADVAAGIKAAMTTPPDTLTREQWEAMSPGQREAAWRYYHGAR